MIVDWFMVGSVPAESCQIKLPQMKMIALSEQRDDGTTVLTVMVDSLDRMNVAEFRDIATRAITASDGRVEVNCSKLEFIDSSGLGAFLHTHNSLPEERRPVSLTAVGPKVLTILELMQVHRIFEIEPRV
jgi:anti-sigma B factor antagonist